MDRANNYGEWSMTNSVKIDTQPPLVSGMIPQSNKASSAKTVDFFWSLSDNSSGVFSNWIMIDTNKDGMTDIQSGYPGISNGHTYTFPGNSTNYWRIKAMDIAGNTNTSSWYKIIINTNLAIPTLYTPSFNAILNINSILFDWSDESSSGALSNILQISTNDFNSFTLNSNVGTETNCNLILINGSYKWRVKTITASTTFFSFTEYLLTVDSLAPINTNYSLLAGMTNYGTIDFNYRAIDNMEIISNSIFAHIKIYSTNNLLYLSEQIITNGKIMNSYTGSIVKSNINDFQINFSSTNPMPNIAKITMELRIKDRAGNWKTNRIWFVNIYDTIPPDLFINRESGSYSGALSVFITAYKDSTKAVIDSSAEIFVLLYENNQFKGTNKNSGTITLAPFESGKIYKIKIYAVDNANNTSITQEREYRVVRTPTIPLAVYPTVINLNKTRRMKFVSNDKKDNVNIKIYTLRGNLVREIHGASFRTGVFEWEIDDPGLFPAGRYIAKVGKNRTVFIIIK